MNTSALWQLLGLGSDLARLSALEVERLGRIYARLLRRLLMASAGVTVLVLLVLLVALAVNAPAWVYVVALGAAGLCAALLTLVSWPVLAPAGALLDRFPGLNAAVQRPLRWAGAIVFGVLWLCAFSMLPIVRANPAVLLLVIAAAVIAALGSFVGVIRVPRATVRSLLAAQLAMALVTAALAMTMPETFAALGRRLGQVDPLLGSELSSGAITLERGARPIDFFSPHTGRPQVWYVPLHPEGFRLFSGPGFDPYTGRKAELADTPDEVRAIQAWLEEKK